MSHAPEKSGLTKENKMELKIIVQIKNVYGEEKIYPVCEKAHLFARLVKQKTLTHQDIKVIKELGYTIEVQQQVKNL